MAEAGGDQGTKVGRGHDIRDPATTQGRARVQQFLEPGDLVRHPEKPDWGLGQVQSAIGARITVNFEHAGKVVIDGSRVILSPDSGGPVRR